MGLFNRPLRNFFLLTRKIQNPFHGIKITSIYIVHAPFLFHKFNEKLYTQLSMSIRYRRRRRLGRSRRTTRRRTFGRRLGRRQKGFVRTQGYYGKFRSISNPLAFQRHSSKELKFNDTSQTLFPIAATAALLKDTILIVPQNTTESGRIGRNIVLKKIMFKGEIHLKAQPDTSLSHDIVRIIVYLDKQANGAAAPTNQLLQNVGVVDGLKGINSFRKLSSAKRFVILMDKQYVFNASTASTVIETSRDVKHIEWYINTNIPIEYSSTGGILTEIKQNNIGILVVSLDGRCEIQGTHRIRYYG